MSASNPSHQKIRSLVFEKLAYEPVLDSDSALKAWVGAHANGVLTHFIKGDYATLNEKQLAAAKPVVNPSTGAPLAKVVPCEKDFFNQAVESATSSLSAWKSLSQVQRGRIIYNIARNYQKHLQIAVACESIPSGRTSRECKELDVTQVIKTLYHFAGACALDSSRSSECNKPVGLVGVAGHYDSALGSLVNKVAPALAAGNVCLIASHPATSLSAFLFAEICEQSGVPAGVVSVLVGNDSDGGSQLLNWFASEPKIAALAFDGRLTRAQELIRESSVNAAQRVLVSCEGKSSLVIYESADFDSAVEAVVEGCFYSNGQHRHSLNKVFIQESVFDDVVSRLEARFKKIRLGNNLDKCNDLGRMLSADDVKLLKESLPKLAENGAKAEQFSECLTDSNPNSIAPAIIKDLGLNTEFNLNEINGPYVSVQKFRTVKESVELINNTKLGAAVSLFSQDISLVLEAANLLNAGTVWINSFQIEKGVQTRKQSGNLQISGSRAVHNFTRSDWEPVFSTASTSREDLDKLIKQFGALDAAASSPLAKNVEIDQTYKLYVGGKQTRPDTQASRPVYKHGDAKEIYCLVPDASRKDVRNAVEAANSAFGSWAKRANFNKAQILYYFGENFQARSDDLAKKLEKVTGKSAQECADEIKLCADVIFQFAAGCDKKTGKLNDPSEYGYTLESNDPLGCVAIICGHDYSKSTPLNRPLLTLITHLIGAIAHGNTAIVVPDEHSAVPGLDLYEIFDTSDMPPGVVNILSGDKRHLAKHLAEHQQVSAVWYLCDMAESAVRDDERAAVQFIKYTSGFNLKRTWFAPTRVPLERNASAVNNAYLDEAARNATQIKIVHCPVGTIFAN